MRHLTGNARIYIGDFFPRILAIWYHLYAKGNTHTHQHTHTNTCTRTRTHTNTWVMTLGKICKQICLKIELGLYMMQLWQHCEPDLGHATYKLKQQIKFLMDSRTSDYYSRAIFQRLLEIDLSTRRNARRRSWNKPLCIITVYGYA